MKKQFWKQRLFFFVVPLIALSTASCVAKASDSSVDVNANDSACDVSRAEIESGTTTFWVTNSGSKTTEVYIYGEGNAIRGEVENIGPGTKRSFQVKLGGGNYDVACKPGQQGDGIRTPIVVVGTADATLSPDRTVKVSAYEWGYSGFELLQAREGENIRFELQNNGTLEHEMEILNPDGNAVGEIGPTTANATGAVTIALNQKGVWTVECGIDGHLDHGMKTQFTVS
ncbi:MAG: hypothetical protein RLZZ31_1536 [Actinomycetota bacterium]